MFENTGKVLLRTFFLLCTGQNLSEPMCFQAGECSQSLFVDEWHVNDAQSCLMECKNDDECLYFTFYKDDSLCLGFANCVEFQEDSCTNCYSGESTCEGTHIYASTNVLLSSFKNLIPLINISRYSLLGPRTMPGDLCR